jgi:hypothetical protein
MPAYQASGWKPARFRSASAHLGIELVVDVLEGRQERHRFQVAPHALDLDLVARLALGLGRVLGEELQGGREGDAVLARQLVLGQHLAVEVGHPAVAAQVQLQHGEMLADVVVDRGDREVLLVHPLAIGAARLLPHDHEALAAGGRLLEVGLQFEERGQIPRLRQQAAIGLDRLIRPPVAVGGRGGRHDQDQYAGHQRGREGLAPSHERPPFVSPGRLVHAGRSAVLVIRSRYRDRLKCRVSTKPPPATAPLPRGHRGGWC